MDGDVLVLGAVLREMCQHVWQPHVSKRLKQPVDAVSAFSPAGFADDGDIQTGRLGTAKSLGASSPLLGVISFRHLHKDQSPAGLGDE